uniref:Ig-like domain-containing protein n=1 Tax=Anas zonorhyncha TaxID=75864 RepID=A0A8B9VV01_9AVES
ICLLKVMFCSAVCACLVLLWSLPCNQRCSLFSCVFLFVFLFSEPLSKPVLHSPTSQVKKGQNATLSCLSEKGNLPITYTFFKGKQSISRPVKMQKKEAAVTFVLINSCSDLGTYKCRAQNNFHNTTKYSNSFNFILAEESCDSQPWIIFLGLILLAFVIGFALAIRFFIIPSCKTGELFEYLFHFPHMLIYVLSTFKCANMLQVIPNLRQNCWKGLGLFVLRKERKFY